MSTRTVKVNELQEGQIFYVRGYVDFSRINSQIAGEELKKDNERRKSRNVTPYDRPYTRISLTKAQGLQASAAGNTLLDTFAKESPFERKNRDASEGPFYEAVNKGLYLPDVYIREADGSLTSVVPEGELAQGLHVTCMMRIYGSKNYQNKGISLDAVICEEPIRYYQGNSTAKSLTDMGMKVNNPTAPRRADNSAETTEATQNQTAPYQPPVQAPPVSAPVAPPQGNPYMTQQPTPQYAAPAAPQFATPMAPAAPAPQMPNNNNTPFPAQPAAPQGGIVYDPASDPNRGY